MGVKVITSKAEFEEVISSGSSVAIDFSAEWCGPCKFISPIFEKLSDEYSQIVFIKVDIDKVPDVSAEIRSVPTFQFYKGGAKLGEFAGANESSLRKNIESLLG